MSQSSMPGRWIAAASTAARTALPQRPITSGKVPRNVLVPIVDARNICSGDALSDAVNCSCARRGSRTGGKGDFVQPTISRRAFVTGLGMLSVPLIAFAQNENKEEKKKEAKEKKGEAKEKAKDKAEDAADNADKAVDRPGTENAEDRRQDRRKDAVKKE